MRVSWLTVPSIALAGAPRLRAALLGTSMLATACGAKSEPPKDVVAASAPSSSTFVPSTTTELPPDAGTGMKLPEKPKGDPGRSPEELRAQIITRRDESRKCYEDVKTKKKNPKLEGQVTVAFTIDPKGKVTEAKTESERTTLADDDVQNCLVLFIKTFQFPESRRGMESKVAYPFVFTRGAPATVTK